jgi:cytochrome c553
MKLDRKPLSARARLGMGILLTLANGVALAQGSIEAGQTKSVTCAACHGADGNSVTPAWPSLAGQHPRYIVRQLESYREGERLDAGMRGFASTLSEEDMLDLAAYFSSQTLAPKGADPSEVSLGQQIYRGGLPDRGIPACAACHGPSGKGNLMAGFPRVSNQHATYLATTLRAYQAGQRRSDVELNQMMRNVSELLLDDEIDALASYMQGLR